MEDERVAVDDDPAPCDTVRRVKRRPVQNVLDRTREGEAQRRSGRDTRAGRRLCEHDRERRLREPRDPDGSSELLPRPSCSRDVDRAGLPVRRNGGGRSGRADGTRTERDCAHGRVETNARLRARRHGQPPVADLRHRGLDREGLVPLLAQRPAQPARAADDDGDRDRPAGRELLLRDEPSAPVDEGDAAARRIGCRHRDERPRERLELDPRECDRVSDQPGAREGVDRAGSGGEHDDDQDESDPASTVGALPAQGRAPVRAHEIRARHGCHPDTIDSRSADAAELDDRRFGSPRKAGHPKG
jgi:hypothetical protein